jgi:hypothetical protein
MKRLGFALRRVFRPEGDGQPIYDFNIRTVLPKYSGKV